MSDIESDFESDGDEFYLADEFYPAFEDSDASVDKAQMMNERLCDACNGRNSEDGDSACKAIDSLIELGADVHYMDDRPWFQAIQSNRPDIARHLVSRYGVDVDRHKKHAMYMAGTTGARASIRYLALSGASPSEALAGCVQNRHGKALKTLLGLYPSRDEFFLDLGKVTYDLLVEC